MKGSCIGLMLCVGCVDAGVPLQSIEGEWQLVFERADRGETKSPVCNVSDVRFAFEADGAVTVVTRDAYTGECGTPKPFESVETALGTYQTFVDDTTGSNVVSIVWDRVTVDSVNGSSVDETDQFIGGPWTIGEDLQGRFLVLSLADAPIVYREIGAVSP